MSARRGVCRTTGRSGVVAVVLSLAMGSAVVGQEPVELLTAVPEAPAFTYLGTSPSLVERPGGLRDFGAAILSGIGPDGRARQGFALDASVWSLLGSRVPVTLEAYQTQFWKFMLANTQLSLGTVRAAADSADTDIAAGLRISVLDRTDPMTDPEFTRALGDALLDCAPATPGGSQSVACVDSVTAARFAEYSAEHWNAARLSVALATGLRLPASDLGEGESSGLDAWAVGGLPVAGAGQIVGQLRYRNRPELDTVPDFSAFSFGLRLLVGSPTWNGFAEYVRESRSPGETDADFDDEVEAWSAGFEFRVTDNTWLATGLGQRFAALGDAEEAIVFANIKWGITSGARMEKLRQ
jgi:hypothetical protein